ncbi:hypothetical protein ACH4FX_40250 [Streptomyces sp. NPDC018019]|uniref:hypothetical protein n=1 Tax=Streptomyces sp. NPDC018019 TaxID=3365030 RepID=UPI0037908D81
MEAAELRERCAQQIDGYNGGYFNGRPWLRTAYLAVPRASFVPIACGGPGRMAGWPARTRCWTAQSIPRAAGGRLRAGHALITQIDDGAVPLGGAA